MHTERGRARCCTRPTRCPTPTTPARRSARPQNPFSEESSTLRVMNAMRADALAHGDAKTPIVSPDANLLADGDPATVEPTRHDAAGRLGAAAGLERDHQRRLVARRGLQGRPRTPSTTRRDEGADRARRRRAHQRPARPRPAGRGGRPEHSRRTSTSRPTAAGGTCGRRTRCPSMEVGLDNLVTTLETDIHLTKDGVPVLSHDPYIDTGKCRTPTARRTRSTTRS